MARQLYKEKTNSIEVICHTVGVSRSTLYRYLHAGQEKAETTTAQVKE
jgi:predicted site-specific integrase-resolvase